jgi:hypothetical protein
VTVEVFKVKASGAATAATPCEEAKPNKKETDEVCKPPEASAA